MNWENRSALPGTSPFSSEGQETPNELMYVKLDDLMKFIVQWLRENPNMERGLQDTVINQWIKERPGMKSLLQNGIIKQLFKPTKRDISKFILLDADWILYSKGVFLSPDLKKPIRLPAVCLVVSLLFLAADVWHSRRKKRRRLSRDIQPGKEGENQPY